MTILSRNGRYRAILEDGSGGINVSFWEHARSDRTISVWIRISTSTIDCPWHHALDQVHRLLDLWDSRSPPDEALW